MRSAFNRAIGAQIGYRGPFASWDEARDASMGYDQDAILERIVGATQRVLHGEARYEQDGIAFIADPPPSHALSALMLAAGRSQGRLSVLDFGGGLASHYLRWRPLLEALPHLSWSIVEQPGYVVAGNRLFAGDPTISFHERIANCASIPNAILASSVLQYLPDPHAVLQELARLGSDVIVLDRTLYSEDGRECISTQIVPRQLGKASYPVWFLSRDSIHAELHRDYKLLAEFEADDQPARLGSRVARCLGSIWVRAS